MKAFQIIAKTSAGELAILQHLEEKELLSAKKRKKYDELYKEKIVSQHPFTLEILVHPQLSNMRFSDVKVHVLKIMVENGASESDVEVVEVGE